MPRKLPTIISHLILILGFLAVWTVQAQAEVSNVRVEQTDKDTVEVSYDLTQAATVGLTVQDHGVNVALTALSGDHGANIESGNDNNIIWNAGTDWPGRASTGMTFTVAATVGEDTTNATSAAAEIFTTPIRSTSHPESSVGNENATFIAEWNAEDFPDVQTGWYYHVDNSPDTVVSLDNGNYLELEELTVFISSQGNGEHWFHLVPADESFNPVADAQERYMFTVEIGRPELVSSSHPDPESWYNDTSFSCTWGTSEDHPGVSGWRWRRTDVQSAEELTTVNSEYLEADARSLELPDMDHGTHWLNLAPVDAAGMIVNANKADIRFNVNTNQPEVSSETHPDQELTSAGRNPSLTWEVAGIPQASFSRYYLRWNTDPVDTPTVEDEPNTTRARTFPNQPDGTHYFHVVAEDQLGNLSPVGGYRVNINEITGPPWGTPRPRAVFSAEPAEGFAPLTVTFTDESEGDITTRTWNFGDDSANSTNPGETFTHIFSDVGEFTVTLTVEGGGDEDSAQQQIIAGGPAADFSANATTGNVPLDVQFTDQSGGDITSWNWFFAYDPEDPDQQPDSTQQSPTHHYAEPGTYAVALEVSGPLGADTKIRNAYITVLPPAPVAAFTADRTSGKPPLIVTFTDESTGEITQREWDFDCDGEVDEVDPQAPIQHSYPDLGIYDVCLTVIGPGGEAIETKADYIEVAANRAPVVDVVEQQIYLKNLAQMATLDASPSSDPDGDPLFFSWREHPGNPHHGLIPIGSDSLETINLYFPAPGQYSFDVRVSDGQMMSDERRTITVYVSGHAGMVTFLHTDGIVRIPNALVRIYGSSADAASNVNMLDMAITDSLGRYHLEHVEPADNETSRVYWMRVDRTGFNLLSNLSLTIAPGQAGSTSGPTRMSRGSLSIFEGRVTTEDGMPVQNAHVIVVPGTGGFRRGSATNSDGYFRISDVPKGTWVLELRGEDATYRPEVRDVNISDSMPLQEYTLQLSPGTATLSGKVYLAGTDRPVSGAKVSLGTGWSTYTNTQGIYSFSNIPIGDYFLTVTRSQFESIRLPVVRVRAGSNEVNLPLSYAAQGPMVYGEVTDAISGDPVRLATVGIRTSGGLLSRGAVSDHTGYYQMHDVPTGNQTFLVTAPGYQEQTFSLSIAGERRKDIALQRREEWRKPEAQGALQIEARVEDAFIYLTDLNSMVNLNGSPSQGTDLRYLWREYPGNPQQGLLPTGSEFNPEPNVTITDPGIYFFQLQVMQGDLVSANTATITVFAPGLTGNVHASPSDGIYGIAGAQVRAYAWDHKTYADTFSESYVNKSAQTLDNPSGKFSLSLDPGDPSSPRSFWLAAKDTNTAMYKQYGPVPRRATYGSALREMQVNVPLDEYELSGTITDQETEQPLENVRIVVAPGSLSESYRTTTDASGRYSLWGVPGGSQLIMVMREGYVTRVSEWDISANQQFDMTLVRSESNELASISGYVTASYEPGGQYEGVHLPVHHVEVIIGAGLARTFTDSNGYYEITSLPPGLYHGTFRKPGYIPETLGTSNYVELKPGENRIDKVLSFYSQGPVVQGRIVTSVLEPIAGAEISILSPADDSTEKSSPVVSDGGGFFKLIDVPHGTHQLEINSSNFPAPLRKKIQVEGNMQIVLSSDDVQDEEICVVYFGNGNTAGTVPVDENCPYESGSPATILDENDLEREGYRFVNWNTLADGSGVSFVPDDVIDLESSLNLYAQWELLGPEQFCVTYDGNGSTGGEAPVDSKCPYPAGDLVTVSGPGDLEKEGFVFQYWNERQDGLGVSYSPGNIIPIESGMILYAQWGAEEPDIYYSVTYQGNDHSGGTAPTDRESPYIANSTVTVLAKGDLVKDGYLFDGWNTQSDGQGTRYDPDVEFTITSNIVLYAQWQDIPTYVLTVNGGSGSGEYAAGQWVPISADVEQGQYFVRWSGDTQSLQTLEDSGSPSTYVIMPEEPVTVTAEYDAVPQDAYSLTVHFGTGSGNYGSGRVVTISAAAPPQGKMFDKWTGDTATVSNINDPTTSLAMPAEHIVVTATYADIPPVRFHLNVDQGEGSGVYPAGRVVGVAAMRKDGLLFDKWTGDTASLGNPNMASTTLVMPSRDILLRATYRTPVDALFTLTVLSGSGSGPYTSGKFVRIEAVDRTDDTGEVFDRWTGDTEHVANPNLPTTIVTMPQSDIRLEALYRQPSLEFKKLTIVPEIPEAPESGPRVEAARRLTANILSTDKEPHRWYELATEPEQEGFVFERWTGQIANVENVNLPSTRIFMPDTNVSVVAEYRDATGVQSELAVINGSPASSTQGQGETVSIAANPPEAGMFFNQWTGHVSHLADIFASETTLFMPGHDVTVEASYMESCSLVYEGNNHTSGAAPVDSQSPYTCGVQATVLPAATGLSSTTGTHQRTEAGRAMLRALNLRFPGVRRFMPSGWSFFP